MKTTIENTLGSDCQDLVRPSITSEQRRDFRQWLEAIGGLSDADKESEAEAWIASALGILGKTNSMKKKTITLSKPLAMFLADGVLISDAEARILWDKGTADWSQAAYQLMSSKVMSS